MTSSFVRAVVVFGVVVACSVAIVRSAEAACHSFTVSASPSSVAEGGKVTVTVTRDAAVNPSSVRVTTVDASARAPGDYTKVDQQVSMTTEESRTLSIQTKNDAAPEGAETFRVRVHDASGCAVNSDFEYGPDAVVTIKASDPATPAPAARTQAPVAPAPAPVVTTAATTPTLPPTPTLTSPTAEATTSPEATLAPQAATETGNGGVPAAAIAAIVLGAIAASGAGLLWYRRRGA